MPLLTTWRASTPACSSQTFLFATVWGARHIVDLAFASPISTPAVLLYQRAPSNPQLFPCISILVCSKRSESLLGPPHPGSDPGSTSQLVVTAIASFGYSNCTDLLVFLSNESLCEDEKEMTQNNERGKMTKKKMPENLIWLNHRQHDSQELAWNSPNKDTI